MMVAFFFISLFFVLVLGYFTPQNWGNASNKNGAITIYVYNSGIHTDLIIPVQNQFWDWQDKIDLKSLAAESKSIKYLAFGFGDRSYFLETYQGQSAKFATTFQALFLPTPPAIRVLLYRDVPQIMPEIKCVKVSNSNYLKLVDFINDSFEIDTQNQKIIIEKIPENQGGFYEARGTYSILRGCNDWTAEALRIAEIKTPLWSSLASSIMWHLKSNC